MRKIIDTELLKLLDEGKSQREIAKHFLCSEPAISKRLQKLRQQIPTSIQKLTDKQKNFAIALATGESKTKAAALAYNVSTVDSARTIGKRLSADSDIQKTVAEILQGIGLTKTYRVNRLRELVDSIDQGVALRALEMTFKLDGSYSPEALNVKITTDIEDIIVARRSAEQAAAEARERAEARRQELITLQAEAKAQGIELPPELATIPDLD